MRKLLACTCLTPVFLMSAPAAGETVIGSATTSKVATSTVKNGARDDIRISSAGSVKPASGGAAVTLDSANSVKNEGTIQYTGVNDATGILAGPGGSGTITNSGKIILDENYTAADADKDGDLDGPFAQGARRFGIRVDNGGTFTGSIVNSGTITIEGNDSAGILVQSRLAGSLDSSGTIGVVGDRSYGVRAGDVTGSVKLSGGISAQGAGAVGAALDGDIGGALVIQGGISATGYRNSTPPADTSKLDADDLLQGGPALRVAGNVAGGILLDAPPADKNADDKDEDDDGVEDAKEGTALVVSNGAAPAMQIGAADRDIAVGAVAGNANGHGLVINGGIAGNGRYRGVTASGLVIGGLGGDVSIAGGATVNGSVSATAVGAGATALRVRRGASLGELRVGGIIAATGAAGNGGARGVSIDAGASLGAVRNKGRITATTTQEGTATAIRDASGTLALVENAGVISATGASAAERNIAIDLRARDAGATVRQSGVSGLPAPSIVGNILFAGGDDLIDLAGGSVTGNSSFGAGSNRLAMAGGATYQGDVQFGAGSDALTLAGTSRFSGTADFGGGSDVLTLAGTSRFTGTLAGSSGLAVTMTGGMLDLQNKGAVALSSLSLSGDSSIAVTIDPASGAFTQYQVAGAASFGAGSKIAVKLTSIAGAEGRYVVVKAGSLSGGAALASSGAALPWMFKSSITADQAAGEIAVDIKRKSATELELNGSQTRAWDAVAAALDGDRKVADSFLAIADGESFRSSLMQMLPDHAGGAFEMVTQGSRATARMLADPTVRLAQRDGWGFWVQQVGWGTSKDLGDTGAYDVSGWGASTGAEIITGSVGNFGASIAYLGGKDDDGASDNEVRGDQYEAAAYWRLNSGGFHADARVSYAAIDFTGTRRFAGTIGNEQVTRTAKGKWDGSLVSASGGASYELRSGRFSLRPGLAFDYYRLKEDSYAETGGGDAFNLSVDKRTSDELAGTLSLAAGLNFGGSDPDSGWFRAEIEGGRRELIGGSLGTTTARFEDGEDFTLLPEQREDGWIGRLRLFGGSAGFHAGGEFSAEEQQGRAAIAFRASLQIGL